MMVNKLMVFCTEVIFSIITQEIFYLQIQSKKLVTKNSNSKFMYSDFVASNKDVKP